MTPFLKIHEELRHGPKSYAQILAGTGVRKTALTDALNQMHIRGDIKRIARGVYALPPKEKSVSLQKS
ncbi:hypothetical protein [Rhodoferax mekongensis]|uniref:Transcriptional regulator n=1 Tax=Rhodoferax mekongensis TaxID=3068341 RepID=A0ABZ0B3U1_9BURK|nr:hypothetical protein [Rhodoferax sp. TBRC 17307]WNO06031.1 hypothetical protein RAN89_06265 [Rhodoferax sp. TBRC 17307]